MLRFFLKAFLAWLAAWACLPLGSNANAGIIEWVRVGDPGNAAAANGFGDVATSFEIMKYEYTNQLYTDFLNSVDANGTNPNSVYNALMGSNVYGGISFTSANAAGSKYAVKSNMGDKPVTYVSWFDAARVCNWAMNGATSSSSTETGAYTLNGQTSGTVPAVNSNAKFFVPTEDQWYKAAYYKGGGTNAGYWNWATQSDTAPSTVTANATGVGSAGNTGNSGNFGSSAGWSNPTVMLTTVGTNGGPSFYGAFDMSGNLSEWNDLTGAAGGTDRGSRGGNYGSSSTDVSSSFRNPRPATAEGVFITFRIAAVPEPSTWVMGAAGIACAGCGAFRRRRAR